MSPPCPGPGTERRRGRLAALAGLLALISTAARAQPQEPADPACPSDLTWPNIPQMRFAVRQVEGRSVLIGEGVIDRDMIPRLQEALQGFRGDEIWLNSPGGDARVGNLAGRLIRGANLTTRIPAGSACASACAFMFLGGILRFVDQHGLLMVQMFTHVSDPRRCVRNWHAAAIERSGCSRRSPAIRHRCPARTTTI